MIVSLPSEICRIQGRKVDLGDLPLAARQVASTDSDSRCPQAATGLTTSMAKRPIRKAPTTDGVTNCQRSEEHTSELQSLMRISYAVFCLKKKKKKIAI